MNQSIDKFDRRLKQLLSISGVERGELARHLGVSVPTVNRWINGISTPNVYQFREIAHFFGMPYDWFLEDNGGIPDTDDLAVKLGLSPAIREALDYVDQHYAEKISLDSIVGHVFINRSYFCQLFKKEIGLTFGDYLERVRIENAKRLLASTNLPILAVAEQSGFSNQAYFTKVFKKCTDVNPFRYRRIHAHHEQDK